MTRVDDNYDEIRVEGVNLYNKWQEKLVTVQLNRAKIKFPMAEITDFCRRHHIRQLAIFGSALREDFGPNSDLDVLVEFEPGYVPGLAFFAMEADLSQILGRKVDLNTPQFLSRYFRDEVQREAVVLYEQG